MKITPEERKVLLKFLEAYDIHLPVKRASTRAHNLIVDALGDSYHHGDHQKIDADKMRQVLIEFLINEGWEDE